MLQITFNKGLFFKLSAVWVNIAFLLAAIVPSPVLAQWTSVQLPTSGTMVPLSAAFTAPMIKGLTIHPNEPFLFDFIIDTGDDHLEGKALATESTRLIKYFLAALTVPEDQLWVNLSPYEKNRIVPEIFGQTEMSRDLLAQDYLLKQLTASLMYPEEELGEEFWKRVYAKAQARYGNTEIPLNTFNKVWIVPEKAVVYVHGESAFVMESHLKVMLEEDYLALEANKNSPRHGLGAVKLEDSKLVSGVSSEVIREILIPEIEREVNEGKIFANLRQIYNAVILATWYKKNLKNSVLSHLYVDKGKTKGVDNIDPAEKERIYEQYVAAFKKGVFDYIKEDYDPVTQTVVSRKYFSGGMAIERTGQVLRQTTVLGEGIFVSSSQRDHRRPMEDEEKKEFVTVRTRFSVSTDGHNLDPLARTAGMKQGTFDQGMKANVDPLILDTKFFETKIEYRDQGLFFNIDGKETKLNWADAQLVFDSLKKVLNKQVDNKDKLKIFRKLIKGSSELRSLLEYILDELQKNAYRAIKDGNEKAGTITVTAGLTDNQLVIIYQDNGSGLLGINGMSDLDTIKDWIFREETSTKEEVIRGHGMGLYEIRKWLTEDVHGQIVAYDNVTDLGYKDTGTTFKINIPFVNEQARSKMRIKRTTDLESDEITFDRAMLNSDAAGRNASSHRLSIPEAKAALLKNLKALNEKHADIAELLDELQRTVTAQGGVDAVDASIVKSIQKEVDGVQDIIDEITLLPNFLGFVEDDLKAPMDQFLAAIAEDFGADKLMVEGLQGEFVYSYGLSYEEQKLFYANVNNVYSMFEQMFQEWNKDQDVIQSGINVLSRLGVSSFLKIVSKNNVGSRGSLGVNGELNIILGRSVETVREKGEFTDQDRQRIQEKLDNLLQSGQAPWVEVKKKFADLGYYNFTQFMSYIRHNSSVDWWRVNLLKSERLIADFMNEVKENRIDTENFFQDLNSISDSIVKGISTNEVNIFLLENGERFETMEIGSLIREQVESFRQKMQDKKISFKVEIPEKDFIAQDIDRNYLKLIVDNLLKNALKYTDQGEITLRLRFGEFVISKQYNIKKKGILLEVQDTGIGIPEDEQKKIFNPRVRASNVENRPGDGLGLDFVKRAIQAMAGRINVESEVGRGSIFTIYLSEAKKRDAATLADAKTPGGIDLNPANLNLQTSGDAAGFSLPAVNPAQWQNIRIDGLVPIILNIAPVSLPQLLGVRPAAEPGINVTAFFLKNN